jgi:hypothetical protein
MARAGKTLLAIAAGLTAAALPGIATAQDAPEAPDLRDEVQTGTRVPMITVIGAIRDPSAPKQAEQPADTRTPELPVVYEDATPGR